MRKPEAIFWRTRLETQSVQKSCDLGALVDYRGRVVKTPPGRADRNYLAVTRVALAKISLDHVDVAPAAACLPGWQRARTQFSS